MKINLRSLSRGVSQKLGIAESKVEEILKAFISEIVDRMRNGQTIHIKSFGTFFIKSRKGRELTNLHTKEKKVYGGVLTPRVKFSQIFKRCIKRGDK